MRKGEANIEPVSRVYGAYRTYWEERMARTADTHQGRMGWDIPMPHKIPSI